MMEFQKKSMSHGFEEKNKAATSSALAAFVLTLFKAVIGFWTGSLGILAEALHSGLDLLAAGMTVVAVRVSGKPADREHPYGHGKVENLSALFETVLLLVTCFWILSAALERIVTGKTDIEVNIWSFIVMFVSIAVDISRSRMLYRTAKQFNSQALEADALHFSTDIWSSAVVILGLFCMKLSEWFPHFRFFLYADAISAMIVGLIVIQVSMKLGIQAISILIDAAPKGLEERIIEEVEKLPGVIDCHQVRVRPSGAQMFIDLHIHVNGNEILRKVHDLTEEIERTLSDFIPHADVTVHPEPW